MRTGCGFSGGAGNSIFFCINKKALPYFAGNDRAISQRYFAAFAAKHAFANKIIPVQIRCQVSNSLASATVY